MENKKPNTNEEKMILKNRPNMQNLNKVNQALHMNSDESLNTYALVLGVVSVIVSVLFFVGKSPLFGFIFLGLGIVLGLSFIIPKLVSKKDEPAEHKNYNPDAIFKEHDE